MLQYKILKNCVTKNIAKEIRQPHIGNDYNMHIFKRNTVTKLPVQHRLLTILLGSFLTIQVPSQMFLITRNVLTLVCQKKNQQTNIKLTYLSNRDRNSTHLGTIPDSIMASIGGFLSLLSIFRAAWVEIS
jgi:hypothetical protein